jgi:hypothetical protein
MTPQEKLHPDEPEWHLHIRDMLADKQVEALLNRFGFEAEDSIELGRELREILISHRKWVKIKDWFWASAIGAAAYALIHFLETKFSAK